MKAFLLLMLIITLCLSDEISLKTGFVLHDVTILEIDHRQLRYSDPERTVHQVFLRDVSSIRQGPPARSGEPDKVFLRNGSVAEGAISDLTFDGITIIRPNGDTARYDPSSVLRVTGTRSTLSFFSVDGSYFFLTRPGIRFVGGKPSTTLDASQYRFIVSAFTSLPAQGFRYSLPGALDEMVKPGYGLSFTIDTRIAPEHALSFSYRFTENTIASQESLGGSFTEWTNHFFTGGVKRYVPAGERFRCYGEAKVGYLFSQSPESMMLTSGQTGSVTWSIGGGVYFTENLSLDLVYVAASPVFTLQQTYFDLRKGGSLSRQQNVSSFLAGISCTFGSNN